MTTLANGLSVDLDQGSATHEADLIKDRAGVSKDQLQQDQAP